MHVHNDVTPSLLSTYPPPDFISLPPPPFILIILSQLVLFIFAWLWNCPLERGKLTSGHTLKEERISLLYHYQLPEALQESTMPENHLLFSMWKIKMTWFCVELVQTATVAASVWVQSPFTALLSLFRPLQSFHLSLHTPRPTSELFGNNRNTNWIYVLRDFKWEAGI